MRCEVHEVRVGPYLAVERWSAPTRANWVGSQAGGRERCRPPGRQVCVQRKRNCDYGISPTVGTSLKPRRAWESGNADTGKMAMVT